MPIAFCPECDTEIHVDEDADKGDVVHCQECETKLHIVGLDPIELDLAPEDDEDDYYSTDDDD